MTGSEFSLQPPTSCVSEKKTGTLESTRQKLLDAIGVFLAEAGMSEDRFGRSAVGSSKLISRLRAGKDVTTGNLDRIYAFMAAERTRRGGAEPLPKETRP
jgi:hypothetical protein